MPDVTDLIKPAGKHQEWGKLYPYWLKAARDSKGKLTLHDWCQTHGLNYTLASRRFTELSRLLVGEKLALISPNAVERLEELLNSDDLKMQMEAAKAILDRSGLSPAAVQVAIQNNVTQNTVVLPPIFPGNYQAEVKQMLEGGSGDAEPQ